MCPGAPLAVPRVGREVSEPFRILPRCIGLSAVRTTWQDAGAARRGGSTDRPRSDGHAPASGQAKPPRQTAKPNSHIVLSIDGSAATGRKKSRTAGRIELWSIFTGPLEVRRHRRLQRANPRGFARCQKPILHYLLPFRPHPCRSLRVDSGRRFASATGRPTIPSTLAARASRPNSRFRASMTAPICPSRPRRGA